jgi:hypothetical protein
VVGRQEVVCSPPVGRSRAILTCPHE